MEQERSDNNQALRARFIRAIDKVLAENPGYRVFTDAWGLGYDPTTQKWVASEHGCCPLGMVLLAEQPPCAALQAFSTPYSMDSSHRESINDTVVVAEALGLDHRWVLRFVDTFDNGWEGEPEDLVDAEKLALEMREKYVVRRDG
jgi:hypothetical protein